MDLGGHRFDDELVTDDDNYENHIWGSPKEPSMLPKAPYRSEPRSF